MLCERPQHIQPSPSDGSGTSAFPKNGSRPRGVFKGGRKGKPGGVQRSRPKSKTPSYAEQGVDKALANKARKMAALTGAEANAVVSRDKTLTEIRAARDVRPREGR